MAGMRNALRAIATDTNEWAGIPMPLEGHRLVIEPTYPHAKKLAEIGRDDVEKSEADLVEDALRIEGVRNVFWSWRWRTHIAVWQESGGKILWGPLSVPHGLGLQMETLSVADAWGIEQESNALATLGRLLRHRQFKQYLMTGMFMERSERSGVSYLFRKLRPTIAITHNGDRNGFVSDDGSKETELRILAALCMHPIAYYSQSWAGAMCPTDDVVAHLMLMRGDEAMFWRRCNQHPAHVHQAGI